MPLSNCEVTGMLAFEPLGYLEAVDDHRLAALHRILETSQKLQRRHRVTIGIVGVCLQSEIGVGEIGGIDLCPDVEPAAIVGLAHVAEERGNIAQISALQRKPGHHCKTEAPDCREPSGQCFSLQPRPVPGERGQARLHRPIPALDEAIRPADLPVLNPVVGVAFEPVHGKAHGLVLGGKGQAQAVAGC